MELESLKSNDNSLGGSKRSFRQEGNFHENTNLNIPEKSSFDTYCTQYSEKSKREKLSTVGKEQKKIFMNGYDSDGYKASVEESAISGASSYRVPESVPLRREHSHLTRDETGGYRSETSSTQIRNKTDHFIKKHDQLMLVRKIESTNQMTIEPTKDTERIKIRSKKGRYYISPLPKIDEHKLIGECTKKCKEHYIDSFDDSMSHGFQEKKDKFNALKTSQLKNHSIEYKIRMNGKVRRTKKEDKKCQKITASNVRDFVNNQNNSSDEKKLCELMKIEKVPCSDIEDRTKLGAKYIINVPQCVNPGMECVNIIKIKEKKKVMLNNFCNTDKAVTKLQFNQLTREQKHEECRQKVPILQTETNTIEIKSKISPFLDENKDIDKLLLIQYEQKSKHNKIKGNEQDTINNGNLSLKDSKHPLNEMYLYTKDTFETKVREKVTKIEDESTTLKDKVNELLEELRELKLKTPRPIEKSISSAENDILEMVTKGNDVAYVQAVTETKSAEVQVRQSSLDLATASDLLLAETHTVDELADNYVEDQILTLYKDDSNQLPLDPDVLANSHNTYKPDKLIEQIKNGEKAEGQFDKLRTSERIITESDKKYGSEKHGSVLDVSHAVQSSSNKSSLVSLSKLLSDKNDVGLAISETPLIKEKIPLEEEVLQKETEITESKFEESNSDFEKTIPISDLSSLKPSSEKSVSVSVLKLTSNKNDVGLAISETSLIKEKIPLEEDVIQTEPKITELQSEERTSNFEKKNSKSEDLSKEDLSPFSSFASGNIKNIPMENDISLLSPKMSLFDDATSRLSDLPSSNTDLNPPTIKRLSTNSDLISLETSLMPLKSTRTSTETEASFKETETLPRKFEKESTKTSYITELEVTSSRPDFTPTKMKTLSSKSEQLPTNTGLQSPKTEMSLVKPQVTDSKTEIHSSNIHIDPSKISIISKTGLTSASIISKAIDSSSQEEIEAKEYSNIIKPLEILHISNSQRKLLSGVHAPNKYSKYGDTMSHNLTATTDDSKVTSSTKFLSGQEPLTKKPWTNDALYLKKKLCPKLIRALAETAIQRPLDPISYLAHWIYKDYHNTEIKDRAEVWHEHLELARAAESPQKPLKKFNLKKYPIMEEPIILTGEIIISDDLEGNTSMSSIHEISRSS